ncbi:replication factor C [Paramecium bursaria Chlorella virus NE-JV-1]|nr:replication factor C [Paramecium bursaria Chlorella virus NE-JV-1]
MLTALLTIKERPQKTVRVPLAILSAPKKIEDAVLYNEKIVSRLKTWLLDGNNDSGILTAACGSGATTLLNLVVADLEISAIFVDHTEKNFQELLATTNAMKCDVVIIDGFDSASAGKRSIDIVKEHAKKSTRKLLCIGHRERKSSSNSFAAKWKHFHFDDPSFERMKSVLIAIADVDIVDRIIRSSPTDIRSCINALEMYLVRPGEISTSDEFVDVIDAIECVFAEITTFENVYRIFEHEPWSIASGVYENYLKSVASLDDIAKLSDSFSAGDVVDSRDVTFALCACTAGFANIVSNKKKIRVEKYATTSSKNAQMFATKKRISLKNFKRQKAGEQALSPVDTFATKFKLRKNR